ncbi:hypothetical protein AMATHDRAFT_158026 [Amanita thiersii Skay4041]|uniref:Uncharacterized protein n=1 Tax=Amanita thiersii Skay4041 TaxID=703135 RepID=A0A2A9NBV8_9AGAR|nr:hypothetical protein AMATHDRAFT_158026 [Amanita thiersii Skay4041]
MAVTTGKLAQRLNAIAATWYTDPFRPNIQLQTFLQSLASHPNLTPRAVDAARALQVNAMQKKYPLSKKMLQPASTPKHYDRLLEGYHKSAQGIRRPWWKIFFGIW